MQDPGGTLNKPREEPSWDEPRPLSLVPRLHNSPTTPAYCPYFGLVRGFRERARVSDHPFHAVTPQHPSPIVDRLPFSRGSASRNGRAGWQKNGWVQFLGLPCSAKKSRRQDLKSSDQEFTSAAWFRDLVSGRRRGVGAAMLRGAGAGRAAVCLGGQLAELALRPRRGRDPPRGSAGRQRGQPDARRHRQVAHDRLAGPLVPRSRRAAGGGQPRLQVSGRPPEGHDGAWPSSHDGELPSGHDGASPLARSSAAGISPGMTTRTMRPWSCGRGFPRCRRCKTPTAWLAPGVQSPSMAAA